MKDPVFVGKCCFIILIIYTICFSIYNYHHASNQSTSKSELGLHPLNQKRIHFATRFCGSNFINVREKKSKCPECVFTENSRRMMEVSDAVVFNCVDLMKIPPMRRPNQIWVLSIFEPPPVISSNRPCTWIKNYRHMFNWTMTYRHDSDVLMPYGRFVPFTEMVKPKLEEGWAFPHSGIDQGVFDFNSLKIPTREEVKRKKMAAWISSNCKVDSKRKIIVEELSKFIQVDKYGSCGKLNCTVPRYNKAYIDCKYQLSNQYKFYLAFENSLCEDYVTEKYFDTLQTQMIPIVYGGANYAKLFPKYSFINAMDFPNLRKLADYLKYLDSNLDEYLKYFEWRKDYWVRNYMFVEGYCSLCKKLWNHSQSDTKVYHNPTEWWSRRSDFNVSGQNACVKPKKFPVKIEQREKGS